MKGLKVFEGLKNLKGIKGSRELFRRAVIAVAVIAALALIALFLYSWLMPKLSYRRLVFAVTGENSITSAEGVRNGMYTELSEGQCIAVASWLAEYRSDNNGIDHASEFGGYELRLHLSDGSEITLINEQNSIVFPGIMGQYRIEVDANEIFTLLADLSYDLPLPAEGN